MNEFTTSTNRLKAAFERVADVRPAVLALVSVIVGALKSGVLPSDSIDTFLVHTSSTATFNAYFQSSPIVLLIAQVFSLTTETRWFVAYLGPTFLFVGLLVWRANRLIPNNPRLVAVLCLLGPPLVIALTEIGRYDIFFLIGAILFLTEGAFGAVLGALLMFSANFEQGVVVALSVVILTCVPSLGLNRLKTLGPLLLGGTLAFLARAITLASVVQEESRLDAFWRNLRTSLLENFQSLPLLVYSGLGILWIPVVLLLVSGKSRLEMLLFSCALLLVPLFVTLTTLDGTRVFLCTAFLPVLLAIKQRDVSIGREIPKQLLGGLFLVAVLLPSVNVYMYGSVRTPYTEIRQLIFGS